MSYKIGSGTGGGSIGGTIASPQVAFGTGVDTIGGSNNFTYANNTLQGGTGHSVGAFTQSITWGDSNVIGANECVALGTGNTSEYRWAVTLGSDNTVSWQASVALGQSNSIGNGCSASIAAGINCDISNDCIGGIALGNTAVLSGGALFSIGLNTTASGGSSSAVGNAMTVSGGNSHGHNHGTSAALITGDYIHGIFHATHLLKTHDNYTDSGRYDLTSTVTTTDNTVTDLFTKTLNDNTAYFFSVDVIARRSDAGPANARFSRRFKVYREAAGVAVLGADIVTPWADETLSSIVPWTTIVDVSTNDVRVRVTGDTGATVEWLCDIRYLAVSGSA